LSFPEFKDVTDCSINDALARVDSIDSLTPLLELLPLLCLTDSGKVFAELINQINRLPPEQWLPPSLIETLLAVTRRGVASETIEIFCDIVQHQKSPAAFAAFAYFVNEAHDSECHPVSFCNPFILENIQDDRSVMDQIASLLVLERLAPCYEREEVPSGLFGLILPKLVSNNEVVRFKSHKAMRRLIESDVFDDGPSINAVLAQQSQYGVEDLGLFFKLVQRFLDDLESPKMDVVQAIYDFSCKSVKESDCSVVKSYSLESLSQIAAIDKVFIEDIFEEGLHVAVEMIKSGHTECFTEISNFFLALSKVYPEATLAVILENVPVLVDSLSDLETGTRKKRMERAESLASIINNQTSPHIVGKIVDFAITSLDSVQGGEVFYICSVILALLTHLDGDLGREFFGKLEKLCRKEVSPQKFNAILHTMKKLLKKFSIDAIALVNDMMNGDIELLGGLPIFSCHDEKTMLFYFMAAFIRQFPDKSSGICDSLVASLSSIAFALVPAVLEPIEAGLHKGIIRREIVGKLYQTTTDILDKLMMTDEEAVCACIDIISQIGKTNPELLDTPALLDAIVKLMNLAGEEDAEEEDVEDSSAYPAIIRFVLEVYSNGRLNAEVRVPLLTALLKSLPLTAETKSMDDIIPLVLTLLEDCERFQAIVIPALVAIANTLMLKKSEFDGYGFSPELGERMKGVLKKIVLGDRSIERQITKLFQGNRPKLNRFSALLK
jgi:hypothetical protein